MPYVRCIGCGMTTYTAARWSNVDFCARCGAELPRRGRAGIATDENVEHAVRERLYGPGRERRRQQLPPAA
jgi:ribosomal protein S27E